MAIKGKNIAPIIKWKVLDKAYVNPRQGLCILCLTEKLRIIGSVYDTNDLKKKF